ncbi:MAG: hypothetical protein IJ835_05305, partial [Muribaculaceae bacterium]|nr:hypothetical protein [Muribaculaceae bacterium]
IHSFIPPPHCPANAGRRPDPINNPALRSASDAGWGRSQSKKPSPDGRPTFVPTHCPTINLYPEGVNST